jgi:hypothetical protein
MRASAALRAARAAGIALKVEGGDLLLEASSAPAPDILDVLSEHKAGIVELLRRIRDGSKAEDWRDSFDELAVAELCGALPRAAAEACAFACCIAEWLNRNAVCSPPGRCLSCRMAEHGGDPLLPFGTDATGHAWLHSTCWRAWHERRKAKAIAALAAQGVNRSHEFRTNEMQGTILREARSDGRSP